MFGNKNTRWFKVFSSVEKAHEVLPLNKPVKVDIGDEIVLLVRTNKGFYAIEEFCPHAKAPLAEGWVGDDGLFICPYHRYKFDMQTGFEKTCSGPAVKLYKTEERADGLFIGKESKGWF